MAAVAARAPTRTGRGPSPATCGLSRQLTNTRKHRGVTSRCHTADIRVITHRCYVACSTGGIQKTRDAPAARPAHRLRVMETAPNTALPETTSAETAAPRTPFSPTGEHPPDHGRGRRVARRCPPVPFVRICQYRRARLPGRRPVPAGQERATTPPGLRSGIHFCIGAPLARLEARIALELLTKRLPSMRLDPYAQLRHVPVPLFRGFTSLPVTWDR